MFVDPVVRAIALLTEGGCTPRTRLQTWPSWRRAFGAVGCFYKHGPPDGGHCARTPGSKNRLSS